MAVIPGTPGNDTLSGTADDDTLTGGLGDDTITGGAGDDTAVFNASTDGADRTNLGDGDDEVLVTTGGAAQVRLTFTSSEVGNGVANDGGAPPAQDGGLAVRMQTEDGADALVGAISRYDDEGVTFIADQPDLTFDVRDLISGAARGDLFRTVTLGTMAANSLVGTSEADYINAGMGDDTLNGGTGNDFLVGGAGADQLTGGVGDDSFIGGGGNDVISGGTGDDTAIFNVATDGVDSVDLGAGADKVSVSAASAGQIRLTFTSSEVGNDSANDAGTMSNQDGGLALRLQAEDGAGALTGGISRFDDEGVTFTAATAGVTFDVRDLVSGTARGDQFRTVSLGTVGADIFAGTAEADYINAGGGDDKLSGAAGADFLVGGGGNDSLDGGEGADSFIGGGGADTILGGEGDDLVASFSVATDGADSVNLGAGSDTFNVSAATGNQVRVTFTSSEVGNGGVNDASTQTNQDGGLAVRLQSENAEGAVSGSVTRVDDEGITFVAASAGTTFDVRDLVSGAARGDQFRTVALGTSGADTFAGTAEADYINGGGGADNLGGGVGADFLVGGGGNDTLNGGDGNDSFIGGGGADSIVGGAGDDIVIYAGARADYKAAAVSGGIQITDNRAGSADGVDTVSGVERFQFSDGVFTQAELGFDALPTLARLKAAYANITGVDPDSAKATSPTVPVPGGGTVTNPRVAEVAQLSTLATRVDAGEITFAQALNSVVDFADDTTTVATLAYQFFTGETPTEAGYEFLVNSATNTNDLTDPYYAVFNPGNLYINFAVNLGALGEGRTQFQAEYGSLTLAQATAKAYEDVFGAPPPAGRVDAILSAVVGPNGFTRADYFAALGGDGPTGLGTKAAMVGFLLAESVKADLGPYTEANDLFLLDLADGEADFNIDLLDVYDADAASPAVSVVGAPVDYEAA